MFIFKPSTEIPHKVWEYVLDRDGWMCYNSNCINPFGRYDNLTVHHIVYRSHGGLGTDPCNLITLCWPCHEAIEKTKKLVGLEDLNVVSMGELIHREQLAFYEHDYPGDYIKCFHMEENGELMKVNEGQPTAVADTSRMKRVAIVKYKFWNLLGEESGEESDDVSEIPELLASKLEEAHRVMEKVQREVQDYITNQLN